MIQMAVGEDTKVELLCCVMPAGVADAVSFTRTFATVAAAEAAAAGSVVAERGVVPVPGMPLLQQGPR